MSDYISKQDVVDILYNTFEEYNMTTDKQDKHGGFGSEVFKRVKDIPTVDETEIIRKCGEQIVDKLKNLYASTPYPNLFSNGRDYANIRAINLVKEECGINE